MLMVCALLAFSFGLKCNEAFAQNNEQSLMETQRHSLKPKQTERASPHKDTTLESQGNRSPLNITLAFAQARLDYKSDRYGRMQGLLLKSHYEWHTTETDRVKLLYSYLGQQESVALTPSLDQLDQMTELVDNQGLGERSPYTYLSRPQVTQRALGWTQNMALGLQWHHEYNESFGMALSTGVNAQFMDKLEPNLSPWICVESQWRYLWLSLNYQGDPCLAINHAQSRLLMGLSLGRARLGLGWGVSRLESQPELLNMNLKDGGTLAWLSLPLNAAIYLEMSLTFTRFSKMWLDEQNELGPLSAFMVGLTWTGEQEIKELEAPKRNRNQTGTPIQPNSPNPQAPPQSQPLFTPNPLQPSSGPNSPSTPL